MRKLFVLAILLTLCFTMGSAQIMNQFDQTQCTFKFISTPATATNITASPAKLCGIYISNRLGVAPTSYFVIVDSASATGVTIAVTEKKIIPNVYISSYSSANQAINTPERYISFDPPIETTLGLTGIADVNGGVEITVFYMPKRTARYINPY